jgi:carbohydrate-selective porin OprB
LKAIIYVENVYKKIGSMTKYKPLRVKENTWKELTNLKYDLRQRSIDDALEILLGNRKRKR